MGNTIINLGPSFGFPSLGLNLGGGLGGGSLLSGLGLGNGLGLSGLGGGAGSIPGLQGTMFKLGFDALTGNFGGVLQDIADLGGLLSNFAGTNASASQPIPSQFTPTGSSGGSSGGTSPNAAQDTGGTCGCHDQGGTQEDRINEMLKKLLGMLGPMLQMFAQLLNLMLDSSGNNQTLRTSIDNSRLSLPI